MADARSTSEAPRLVVGGGRAPARCVFDASLGGFVELEKFPDLKPADVSINIDIDAVPHVVADINRAPFADAVFREVYFEKVPFKAFTGPKVGAIKEAARILQPGGRCVIETGSVAPAEQIKAAMREAGFKYIRVTDKRHLRITGRLGGRK